MKWLTYILAAALLVWVNKRWAPFALKRLRVRFDCDHIMAEPGETVAWSAVVENTGRLPVPFVRLRQIFPGEAAPCAEEKWIKAHCQQGLFQWTAEERLAIPARCSAVKRLSLTLSKRGEYRLGAYRLSAGDLLGLQESGIEGSGQNIVVIPECSTSVEALRAVGGFIGDISVRRFILEDPVLTVGFRDYTGREPLKAVSWIRTAAAGSMQVKQYDHTAEQTVTILLNVEGGDPEALESCFRLTRMACQRLERQKIPYALRTNGNLLTPVGKLFHLTEGLGDSHLSTILYALGRADYTCFHSLEYLVDQTLKKRKSNEAYILITPSAGERERMLLRKLEQAAGNPVCVLSGAEEGKA